MVPIVIFLPLLFPTGRALSLRWRRFARVAVVVTAVSVVAGALMPGRLENYPAVHSPFGVSEADIVFDVCFALIIAGALASVASLALRFRRSHGIERQQIKWVWAAGAVLVVCFALAAVLPAAIGEQMTGLGLLAVPVGVAVAILRYRLYDIAVVVNRTLVYGSLTAALALVYLASVLLLQLILRPVTE